MYMVNVDPDKCTGCEECVNICPNEIFKMDEGRSDPYQSAECVFCESCLGVCPRETITIIEI
jgi:ferredoxin